MTENSLRSEPVKNTILRTLPSAEFIVLRAFLTRVQMYLLNLGQTPIGHVVSL
jgi:hypothetical protein